jgi:hypothetical protein
LKRINRLLARVMAVACDMVETKANNRIYKQAMAALNQDIMNLILDLPYYQVGFLHLD